MVTRILLLGILLTARKHSQKKRFIASQYANSNIMRSQVMGGIQDRADAFIKKCVESGKLGMDAYVSFVLSYCTTLTF